MKEHRYGFCFVFNEQGKVLVLRRSKTAKYRPHEWDLPGGVLGLDEEPIEGVVREVKEETGLQVNDLELIVDEGGEWDGEWHRFFYFRAATINPKVTLSYEHAQYEWHDALIAATMVHYKPHVYGFSKAINEKPKSTI